MTKTKVLKRIGELVGFKDGEYDYLARMTLTELTIILAMLERV